MSEQINKTKTGVIAAAAAACVTVALGLGIGFGSSFAVADNADGSASQFGIGQTTSSTTSAVGKLSSTAESSETNLLAASTASDTSVLTSNVNYDVMVGVYQIEAAREAERLAAEEAARAEERAHIEQAQANYESWLSYANDDAINGLEEVDWTVGKEAFIEEWGSRINAYLANTTLAGYGEVFATAAWEYGVDPRWSPAISNTESGNGYNCFLPHNAWGWGSSSWSSWTQAINDHVAGLASNYGYSITYAFAAKYCPPNTEHWFNNTISQMQRI